MLHPTVLIHPTDSGPDAAFQGMPCGRWPRKFLRAVTDHLQVHRSIREEQEESKPGLISFIPSDGFSSHPPSAEQKQLWVTEFLWAQICWMWQKTSSTSDRGFQRFLDNVQYKSSGILRYERIFGEGFVSTGGLGMRPDTYSSLVHFLRFNPRTRRFLLRLQWLDQLIIPAALVSL